jgi:hypothetical protein
MLTNATRQRFSGTMVLVGMVMLICSAAAAETYYVSLKGDDTNKGMTEEAAFRTIKKGASVLKAGDTLIIKSGDYGSEQVRLRAGGKKGSPITIKAEQPGKAIMTGTGGGRAFRIIDISHIVIEGITITRYSQGINIRRSSHITVRKCIFLNNNASGITLNDGNPKELKLSHDHLFTENQFLDYSEKGPGSPTVGKGIQDYGLCMYFSSKVEVTNNYFYGHHHQCCSFKEIMVDCRAANNVFDGFYFTAIYLGQNDDDNRKSLYCKRSRNLVAEGNIFRPTKKYRAKNSVVVANCTNAIVRNNFVDSIWGTDVDLHDKTRNVGVTTNFPAGGIHIAPCSTGTKVYGNVIINATKPGILIRTGDCEIYNNTIVGCDWGLAIVPGAHPVVKNNIFYKNKVQVAAPPRMETWNTTEHRTRLLPDKSMWKWKPEKSKKTVYEHNNWLPRWAGMGKTGISADPKFVGPFAKLKPGGQNPRFKPDFKRAWGYRLGKGSPCIDKGIKTGLPFVGKSPDIGAFEFGAKAKNPIQKGLQVKCVECGKAWEITRRELPDYQGRERRDEQGHQIGGDCPHCKKKGCAFVMIRCPNCKKYYLSKRVTDPEGFTKGEVKDTCPHCGTNLIEWYKKHRRRRGR